MSTARHLFDPLPRLALPSVVAALLVPAAAFADTPWGATTTVDASINGADDPDIGDVDGDGDLDVVYSGVNGDVVRVARNDGGGTWTVATVGTGDGPRGVKLADLDGDGDLDAVVAYGSDSDLVWYANDGTGAGWTKVVIDASALSVWDAAIGDFDGDGDLDVAATLRSGTPRVAWYENTDGVGTAWTQHTVDANLSDARPIEAADLDGDGSTDLVAGGFGAGTLRAYRNTSGDGSTWVSTSFGTASGPYGLDVGDVDGDGDIDVAAANYHSGTFTVQLNDGTGTGWTDQPVGSAGRGLDVVIRDFDGDGDGDVVGTTYTSDSILFFENLAAGTSWAAADVLGTPDNPFGLDAADLDGDGDDDVVAALIVTDAIIMIENERVHATSSGFALQTISTAGNDPRHTTSADVDGDGALDVVVGGNDGLRLLTNGGAGSAWTPTTLDTTSTWASGAGDLDGDGDVDPIGVRQASGELAWFRNDGAATFVRTVISSTLGTHARDIDVGDLDRDGDLDIVVAGGGNTLRLFLNDGAAASFTQSTITTGSDAFSVDLVDMDRDGDLDVLFAADGADRFAWYENNLDNAAGWLETLILSGSGNGADGARWIRAADIDRDGDVDAVGIASNSGVLHLFTNTDGVGGAWTASPILSGLPAGWFVEPVDVDGDGDLDLYSSDGTTLRLHDNDGAGTFTATTLYTGSNVLHGDVGDFDGDGDLDVVVPQLSGAEGVHWFDNERHHADLTATALPPAGTVAANTTDLAVLEIDASHLGRAGDANVRITGLGLQFTDGSGGAVTQADLAATLTSIDLYRDTGDGVFTVGTDPLVQAETAFAVDASGTLAVAVHPNASDADWGVGGPGTFFVTVSVGAVGAGALPTLAIETAIAHGTSVAETGEFVLLSATEAASASVTLVLLQPPTAVTSGPYAGDEGAAVAVDGSGSTDSDGTITAWDWDCDDDGTYETAGQTATCTFDDEGTYDVGLRVTDDSGLTDSATTTVAVANVAPTFDTTPTTALVEGTPWSYLPTVTDPGNDTQAFTLSAGAPAAMTIDGGTGELAWTPTYADVGTAAFDLTVDDGDGGTATQGITLVVAFLDVDNDGLPDSWETANGLDPTVDDSALDGDADGLSNLDEFLGGTDPASYDGPSVPTPTSPADAAEVADARPALAWSNATDPQGEALTYEVELYADSTLATLVEGAAALAEDGSGTTTWTPSIESAENADAYWRVRASDAAVDGAWSALTSFFVNAVEEAPTAPTAASPLDGQRVDSLAPALSWTEAADVDRDPLTYEVRVTDADGADVTDAAGETTLGWTLDVELVEDGEYAWQVRACDDTALCSPWTDPEGFLVDVENSAPADVVWVSPTDGDAVEGAAPTLEATASSDPEREDLTYVWELDTASSFDSGDLVTGTTEVEIWDLAAAGIELVEDIDWNLRVRVEDPRGAASAWAVISVFVRGDNDAPAPPALLSPDDAAALDEAPASATFVFGPSVDPEADPVTYEVVVASDAALADEALRSDPIEPGSGPEGSADQTSWAADGLGEGTWYWSVRATDDLGAVGEWAEPRSVVVGAAPGPAGCEGCESSFIGASGGGPGAGLLLLVCAVVARRRVREERPARAR